MFDLLLSICVGFIVVLSCGGVLELWRQRQILQFYFESAPQRSGGGYFGDDPTCFIEGLSLRQTAIILASYFLVWCLKIALICNGLRQLSPLSFIITNVGVAALYYFFEMISYKIQFVKHLHNVDFEREMAIFLVSLCRAVIDSTSLIIGPVLSTLIQVDDVATVFSFQSALKFALCSAMLAVPIHPLDLIVAILRLQAHTSFFQSNSLNLCMSMFRKRSGNGNGGGDDDEQKLSKLKPFRNGLMPRVALNASTSFTMCIYTMIWRQFIS
jgi:hypothetical protein